MALPLVEAASSLPNLSRLQTCCNPTLAAFSLLHHRPVLCRNLVHPLLKLRQFVIVFKVQLLYILSDNINILHVLYGLLKDPFQRLSWLIDQVLLKMLLLLVPSQRIDIQRCLLGKLRVLLLVVEDRLILIHVQISFIHFLCWCRRLRCLGVLFVDLLNELEELALRCLVVEAVVQDQIEW